MPTNQNRARLKMPCNFFSNPKSISKNIAKILLQISKTVQDIKQKISTGSTIDKAETNGQIFYRLSKKIKIHP